MIWRTSVGLAFVLAGAVIAMPLSGIHACLQWCKDNSAALQSMAAIAGVLLGTLTLIYLIRYSNDTREITRLSQSQFDEVQQENRARRLLEFNRLLSEDTASMPSLLATISEAPPEAEGKFVLVQVRNFGLGDAMEAYLYDETAKKLLINLPSVRLNQPHTTSVPTALWDFNHIFRLIYSSPHSSIREQIIKFNDSTSQQQLSDTIKRPYQFLIEGMDTTRAVYATEKHGPPTNLGSGQPLGEKFE